MCESNERARYAGMIALFVYGVFCLFGFFEMAIYPPYALHHTPFVFGR